MNCRHALLLLAVPLLLIATGAIGSGASTTSAAVPPANGGSQPIATVNGDPIPADAFQRFQGFEDFLLTARIAQLQQLLSRPGDAPFARQELRIVQDDLAHLPAYTLRQMEQVLELRQAAVRIDATPTQSQIAAEYRRVQRAYDRNGSAGSFAHELHALGVTPTDVQAYYVAPVVVVRNVIQHFQGRAPRAQPWAVARHILVATQSRALLIQKDIENGGNFAMLARRYSIDNGIQPGAPLTGTARLQAEQQSSAYNGGWLRDPQPAYSSQRRIPSSVPSTATYRPTWLTPQTGFVKPVLDAILSMKAGEVRVVQSLYGFHVVQVVARQAHLLSVRERDAILQQQGEQGYQLWFTEATDPARNRIVPPDPYAQFPQPTPTP